MYAYVCTYYMCIYIYLSFAQQAYARVDRGPVRFINPRAMDPKYGL